MDPVHTDIQIVSIGGVPHVQGRLVPPFVPPNILLPDQQAEGLVQRIIYVAQQQFPNRRSGTLRMETGEQQAYRYPLSIPATNLPNFDYDQLFSNIEKMINSNDALEIGDVTFVLVLPNPNV